MKRLLLNSRLLVLVALMSSITFAANAQTPPHHTNASNGVNGYRTPWGNTTSSNFERSQCVYEPSDFVTGNPPRGFITGVWFRPYAGSASYNGTYTLGDLTVKLGHTTQGSPSTSTWYPVTTVYGPKSTTLNWTQGVWFELVLDQPFYYDGTSNLTVDVFCSQATVTGKYAEVDNHTAGGLVYGTTAAPTTGVPYIWNLGLSIFPGYPCTDTPKSSVRGPKQVCPNKQFTVGPDSFYADADYIWEYSTNGTNWSNFLGTVGQYGEISDIINAAKWYRVTITCKANTSLTWTSPPHKVGIAPFYYCYCDEEAAADTGANIGNLTVINSNQLDTILNKAELFTGTGTPVYSNPQATKKYTSYHDSLQWPCLYRDTNYIYHISQIHSENTFVKGVVQAYIDYNRDGQYDPNTERLFVQAFDGNGTPPQIIKTSATVPTGAQTGPTGLRVVLSEDTINGGPCGTYNGAGEVEDYIVDICYEPCRGPVSAGTVESTDSSMCTGYEYMITDTLYDRKLSGFDRAWQVSGDNVNWQNIPNSLNKDTLQRVFQGQPLYYRLRTVCVPTSDTNYSQATLVNDKPGYKCYCYSKAIGGLDVDTSDIGGVTIASYSSNAGGPHLQNALAVSPRTDYTDIAPIEMYTDSTYEFRLYHTMPVREHGDAKITVFMDFNNNHEYDIPEERIFTGYTTIGNHTLVDKVVVPKNAITDVLTGMRVIVNNDVGPNIPSDQACGGYMSGETEDYLLIFRKAWPAGINGIEEFTGFRINPNPSTGKFNINFSANDAVGPVQVSITNVTGQVIDQQVYEYGGGLFSREVDMGDQPAGVYFVELDANSKKFTRKLILK